jgi:SpoU rRNA methylase family enzyme
VGISIKLRTKVLVFDTIKDELSHLKEARAFMKGKRRKNTVKYVKPVPPISVDNVIFLKAVLKFGVGTGWDKLLS